MSQRKRPHYTAGQTMLIFVTSAIAPPIGLIVWLYIRTGVR